MTNVIYFKAGTKEGYILPSKQVELSRKFVHLWEPNHFLYARIDLPRIRGGMSFKEEQTGVWKTYIEINS